MPSELSKSVGELEKEKPTVAPKWSVKRFLEPFDKSGKRQTRGPSIG
jgi:hypothetical protein